MRKDILRFCIAFLIGSHAAAAARTTDSIRVAVAKYSGDRAAAVSYTFDDGLLEQYTELFPQLKKYGLKATFCVNGRTIDAYEHMIATGDSTNALVREKPRTTWAMLREMSDDGQEITSHGWSHTNVKKIDGEALRYELEHNDSVIFAHTGVYPRTFFYPGNAKSPEKVEYCSRGRVGTRTWQVSIGSKRSEKWLREWVDSLVRTRGRGIGMTHGISRGYDHFARPQILWNHLAYVSKLRDSLWVGTFHDVEAYVRERDAVTLSISQKGSTVKVTPTLPLDSTLFHFPLTLTVDRSCKKATQDGKSLTVTRRGGKSLIDFNPQGGSIVIKTKKK